LDVVVDIRPNSPTFDRWVAVEISAENFRHVCTPLGMAYGFWTRPGMAHGFWTRPGMAHGFWTPLGMAYGFWTPLGMAHGFSVLAETAEFCYKVTAFYHPEDEKGIRWDDPALAIDWRVDDPILSARDRALPLLSEATDDLPD
jgi:dTDP-4-dehydrorhamnose 3,5-epimerase-like enzyme